jgi:zinc protease
MRKISGKTCLLVVCLAAVAAFQTASGQARPGESVLRATLPNGLRVVIVRNPLSPVATTVVNYRVGSDEAPAGFPGMAHAQEHMMFRGSQGLSADQLAAISAAMGGNFDADTQQTVTQYFFTVPAEDLDLALHIEAIRMRGALDTEQLWQQERGAIEQEVAQDLSNPEYVFYTKLLAAMFHGTPYAHDALGTRASFNQTTGEMLQKFHETWYTPNNAILVIVGDVNPEKALASVRELFGGIPSKPLPPRPEVRLEPVKPQKLELTTDLPYGLAVIAFRLPGSHSPDYAATQILADVLSSQRGALYALVPEGKALFAEFALSSLPEASLGYALAAFPAGKGGPALLEQVRQVIASEVKKGLPAELVAASKRQEVAQAEFEKNSVSGLAMEWSEALAVEDKQSPEQNVREIEKVTVDDVNRVARKYLDLDHAIVAVLTPQPSGKPVSAKGFGGRESFAPKQVKPVALPDWAKAAMNRLEVPPSTVHPTVTKLDNGLTLIVQPESISNTVSVYGHIKNNADLETPKGQDGVSGVLDQLFSYGTTTLDRLAFQKALDDIAAEESAGLDFSLRVLPDHFERGVELLAENELRPALPEEAFKIVRQQAAAAQAGEIQSPDYLTRRALDSALFPPKDPTLRQATPATISALAMTNVKDYYAHVYRPDLTAIVVIGNVTPEHAKTVIEKYFGAWKASGPKPQTDLPTVPPNKPVTTAVPDTSRVQDKVILGQTLGLNRFNPDYYALQLGNHVLGGAFYATRLYRELRANTGLVYYVDSSFEIGRTRGVYAVEYGCDPPNVAKARAIVQRELLSMQNAPVTPEELKQAKALLLREIPLSESSVDSIASGLLSRATIGLPLDEPTLAAHRYLQLTAAEVQAAYSKWLRPGDLVQVTEGPAPK